MLDELLYWVQVGVADASGSEAEMAYQLRWDLVGGSKGNRIALVIELRVDE